MGDYEGTRIFMLGIILYNALSRLRGIKGKEAIKAFVKAGGIERGDAKWPLTEEEFRRLLK